MVNKVTVAGLKKLSQSGKLDPEPQRWVDATISLLESDNPKDASSDVKKLIVEGCAKNGYPLQNLDPQNSQRENKLPETVVTKFLIESGRSRRCQFSGP